MSSNYRLINITSNQRRGGGDVRQALRAPGGRGGLIYRRRLNERFCGESTGQRITSTFEVFGWIISLKRILKDISVNARRSV